jgi:N-methylhydantoinase B/oxoprolinase/acetone carboxylase alpha subunit
LPTVTDASVVLGYIDAGRFAGGTMRLDPAAARTAIEHHIAGSLGLSVEDAALGIHRVLNAQMAEAIRLVSIGRGIDPRGYALIPLGGAGPMHGTALAEELGIQAVVVPPHPGVLAAAGLLGAPVEHEVAAAFPRALAGLELSEVRAALAGLDAQCAELMRQEGALDAVINHYADVCYIGQSYHLQVRLDAAEPDALATAYRDFQIAHDRVYGHQTDNPARIVNLRTVHRVAAGRVATVAAAPALAVGSGEEPVQRMIRVRQSDEPVAASVWRRDDLRGPVRGPAIIEQADTTTLVEPGWIAEPGENGRLLLRPSSVVAPDVVGGFDPITMEVIRHKLEGIANEMQSTLLRSSFSPIVKEGLDASAGLFTADGVTLAQAVALPIHLATLIPVLRRVIDTFPPETMDPGDIFLMNDPYCGGTHLPDIAIVQPVIVEGKVLAFAAAMTHHQDMGGLTPGSVPTNATEIFQEGLRIPLLKFRDRGVINETLVAMIRQNVRIPDTVMGDIHAQVAACGIGARRLTEIAVRYGSGMLTEVFAELLNRSETMTRQALAAIPEGTYRFVDFLDNDGIEFDKDIRIEVAVTIRDGGMHVDCTGTSRQVRGPLNCVPSGSMAAACFAIRALTDPSIPTNGGCFRPISLHLPPGSLLNPIEPAPVNARTSTIKRVTGSIISALAGALPDRAPAASACEMLMVAFGGRTDRGKAFVIGDLVAGGSGASRFGDGVDVIETDASNCMNLPAEAMEMEAPIRVNRVALAPGSGGSGEFRGGLGTIREYETLVDDVAFTHRGERHYSRARGLAGGGDGGLAHGAILRADGTQVVIPSKMVTRLGLGDRVIVRTAGGGGYGDPIRRGPEREALDVADGKTAARIGTDVPSNRTPNRPPV